MVEDSSLSISHIGSLISDFFRGQHVQYSDAELTDKDSASASAAGLAAPSLSKESIKFNAPLK